MFFYDQEGQKWHSYSEGLEEAQDLLQRRNRLRGHLERTICSTNQHLIGKNGTQDYP